MLFVIPSAAQIVPPEGEDFMLNEKVIWVHIDILVVVVSEREHSTSGPQPYILY